MTENEAWGQAFENGRKVGDAEGYTRGRKDAIAEAGDLISRKGLIDAIVNTPSKVAECHSGDVLTALADRQNEILDLVEEAPAIDAEPVKHRRWLPRNRRGNNWVECSECHTVGSPFWRRCPVCEAKMDGDGDG